MKDLNRFQNIIGIVGLLSFFLPFFNFEILSLGGFQLAFGISSLGLKLNLFALVLLGCSTFELIVILFKFPIEKYIKQAGYTGVISALLLLISINFDKTFDGINISMSLGFIIVTITQLVFSEVHIFLISKFQAKSNS